MNVPLTRFKAAARLEFKESAVDVTFKTEDMLVPLFTVKISKPVVAPVPLIVVFELPVKVTSQTRPAAGYMLKVPLFTRFPWIVIVFVAVPELATRKEAPLFTVTLP
jgi:hypothetical protein